MRRRKTKVTFHTNIQSNTIIMIESEILEVDEYRHLGQKQKLRRYRVNELKRSIGTG